MTRRNKIFLLLHAYNRIIINCFFNKPYLSQSQANKIKLSNGRVVTVLAQSSFLTGFRRHLAAQEKKKNQGWGQFNKLEKHASILGCLITKNTPASS